MKSFRIERTYLDKGTQGMLYDDVRLLCYTIERSRTDPQYPCIPEGWYTAKRYFSPINNCKVWLLQDVPGRTMIEFHPANWPHELLGCIAPGKAQAIPLLNGEPGVGESRLAFDEFMQMTQDEQEIVFQIVENQKTPTIQEGVKT